MPLLLAFLIVPLIEIALFIQVGGAIGLWSTLGIVVITAVLGAYLVRQQGQGVLARVQNSFQNLQDPSQPLAEGAMILFSGALLLTPGFFTDAVGFALLVPGVRIAIFERLRKTIKFQGKAQFDMRVQPNDDVIEGTYEPGDDTPDGPKHPSGWTRH